MKKGDVIPVDTRGEQLKQRVEKRQEAIVAKCHPAIFELASIWKESIEALNALGPNPPREIVSKIRNRVNKRLEQMRQKYSGSAPPPRNTFAAQVIYSNEALQNESDQHGMAEWLHFERHRIPFKVDAAKRLAKDYAASRRILRTIGDLEALRCRQQITPVKGEVEHRSIFQTLWGFGVEELTPEELVIFFDTYCPCGCEHDPDVLKKSRNRFRRTLENAIKSK